MAAYQPQPLHPGMNPHGHPGGMQQNMQHMGQQMMQQGVSGPGQAQMSQTGAMMGMPAMSNAQHPGAGMPPNQGMGGQSMPGQGPGAMAHMTPQQVMRQQQMQASMQSNPQMMMQHQARLMQHQQQLNAQALSQNGMMGLQPNQMQGMTPQQQMALLQQQSSAPGHPGGVQGVQLPQHLQQQQQQIMQQRMMQQHQQQQAQQAQQNQAALQQQQLAMQHANSQQSNPGQPGPQPQQGQQAQPPHMRPQSRVGNPNEQTPGPQQQQHPQGQQSQSQQSTPQQSQQPNPQQGQQMNQQQLAQAQQHQRMVMMRQQQQQQQMQQQRMQQAQQQQAQAQAQQQQHTAGQLILRVNLLCDHLSNFNISNGSNLLQWNDFVDKHFAENGRLLHSFDDNPNKPKTYEVLRPTIARYFLTYFESGAQSLRLHIEHAHEVPMGNNRFRVSCSNATLTVAYPTGARLEMTGSLNVLFAPISNGIECLELQQSGTEETLTRSQIEHVLSTWSPTMPDNKSPKMAKNKLPKAQQKLQQRLDGLTIESFPHARKGTMGVTSRVQQFLELGETMNFMAELMQLSQERKLRPEQALDVWAVTNEEQQRLAGIANANATNPQINLPGPNGVQQGMPMGNRTPSLGNMAMPGQGNFSSPAMGNMALPMQQQNGPLMNGSPHIPNTGHPGQLVPGMQQQPNSHTPSPRQGNMAAPPMVPQHSQQGTSSSAASANTSPQVSNKRRRSTVKIEEEGIMLQEGGGPPLPGAKTKGTPRMQKKGKPGGQG
ncbi:hypothetical protein LTR17_015949 [Elasticomyces elasticus]|nr:hypothetical protein LTR17_015949 [Elasticomyces elasticus]